MELDLNKSNVKYPSLNLDISVFQGKLKTKIYDKKEDVCSLLLTFPFSDCDVPLGITYGVYISQLVHVVRYASVVPFRI